MHQNTLSVHQAVVLAAGDGDRLGILTQTQPKPLLQIGGRALIDYVITSIVAAGIRRITIVTGYQGEMIQAYLGDGARYGVYLTYTWNPRFREGNAVSLARAAASLAAAPFLLLMADHLLSPEIVCTLVKGSAQGNALAVDCRPHAAVCRHEATKVEIGQDGYIRRLGKNLPVWDGLDTGVFRLQPSVLSLAASGAYQEISELMNDLIRCGEGLRACDVSGAFWLDIDTPADLALARRLFETDGFPTL